jgi:hypothetical protein
MIKKLILIVTLVLMASKGWGAVAFDNYVSAATTNQSTLTSSSFTITNASNRAAILCVYTRSNRTITSASVGGVSASAISGADIAGNASDRIQCWGVVNPPSGSQTATVNLDSTEVNAFKFGVITASNVDQTTTFNHGNSAQDYVNSRAISITSTSGDLTSTAIGDSGAASFTTTQTKKYDIVNIAGDIGPGTGTTTHTWTRPSGSNWMIAVGANFVAYTAPPPSAYKTIKFNSELDGIQ